MQRPILLVVVVALAWGVAGVFAWAPGSSAQTSAPPVLDACSPGRAVIAAAELPDPAQAEPGRKVFDLERCPVGGRIISDIGVGSVLPAPGYGVHPEALTTAGAETLKIKHLTDGTVVLDAVGSGVEGGDGGTVRLASSPGECQDTAYLQMPYRLYANENWFFNRSTTPNELGVLAAEDKLREGGTNIASVNNNCGKPDGVGFGMSYQGDTSRGTGISAQGGCTDYDGFSVVAFGDLPTPENKITLGAACQSYRLRANAWDELAESNIKLNKVDATWTTSATSDTCRNRYGLETVMTHERGHTFGLDDISESSHANLTMSGMINGPCQSSEVTLGRGDAGGLNVKYP